MAEQHTTPRAPRSGLRREVCLPRRSSAGPYRALAVLSISLAIFAGLLDAALWRAAQRDAARPSPSEVAVPQVAVPGAGAERCREPGPRGAVIGDSPLVELGGTLVHVELIALDEVQWRPRQVEEVDID